jgi:hypothetical protein
MPSPAVERDGFRTALLIDGPSELFRIPKVPSQRHAYASVRVAVTNPFEQA